MLGQLLRRILKHPDLGQPVLKDNFPQLMMLEPSLTDHALPDVILQTSAPRAELLFFLLSRAQIIDEVIQPHLSRNANAIVILDRYIYSTVAYQGYGRGLDLTRVREAIDFATGGLQPDLYLVLDLPVDEGRARQHRDGAPEDRIEAAGTAFREAVRDGYLALAASEPNVEVVSARGTAEEVHARIRDRLGARFPDTFGPLEAIHPDRTV